MGDDVPQRPRVFDVSGACVCVCMGRKSKTTQALPVVLHAGPIERMMQRSRRGYVCWEGGIEDPSSYLAWPPVGWPDPSRRHRHTCVYYYRQRAK